MLHLSRNFTDFLTYGQCFTWQDQEKTRRVMSEKENKKKRPARADARIEGWRPYTYTLCETVYSNRSLYPTGCISSEYQSGKQQLIPTEQKSRACDRNAKSQTFITITKIESNLHHNYCIWVVLVKLSLHHASRETSPPPFPERSENNSGCFHNSSPQAGKEWDTSTLFVYSALSPFLSGIFLAN